MKKKVRLAFAIFKYFPFGGLQGDMLRFAECAAARDIEVVIFCDKWQGPEPVSPHISIRKLPVRGFSNHARSRSYEKLFQKAVKEEFFDALFAFSRIGGCDFYFAADNCLAKLTAEKHSPLLLKLLPRYRTFLKQERDIFSPESKTVIFTISPHQQPDYIQHYRTQPERFIPLPPGIRPDCRFPGETKAAEIREKVRQEFNIPAKTTLLITVGANLELKGGDRTAAMMQDLPADTLLLLVGNPSPQLKQTAENSKGRIICAGPRKDIPELLWASDLMVHPARVEATGNVLLEAIAAGVPAVATACCGFSGYLQTAGMPVVPEPFTANALLECTRLALNELKNLQKKSLEFANSGDFYSRYEKGISLIQQAIQP